MPCSNIQPNIEETFSFLTAVHENRTDITFRSQMRDKALYKVKYTYHGLNDDEGFDFPLYTWSYPVNGQVLLGASNLYVGLGHNLEVGDTVKLTVQRTTSSDLLPTFTEYLTVQSVSATNINIGSQGVTVEGYGAVVTPTMPRSDVKLLQSIVDQSSTIGVDVITETYSLVLPDELPYQAFDIANSDNLASDTTVSPQYKTINNTLRDPFRVSSRYNDKHQRSLLFRLSKRESWHLMNSLKGRLNSFTYGGNLWYSSSDDIVINHDLSLGVSTVNIDAVSEDDTLSQNIGNPWS